ncbi:MAG: hypothetical protein V4598_16075 [Bdellovibrionota bacterium]
MSVLFIDSSYDITLGLLDENLGWHDLRVFRGQRASATLQTETHKLMKDFHLEMKNLKGVVSIAGPGFYTGLRLSEGFADVTKFFTLPHNSFYSYEVPLWLGHNEGTWITKAYRGEYFIYDWKGETSRIRLISTKDLPDLKITNQVFIHSDTSLDEKLSSFAVGAISTSDLLKNHSQKIFSHVLKGMTRESYYFRAPEDEFRMNP